MRLFLTLFLALTLHTSCAFAGDKKSEFKSSWHNDLDRHWLSENFWGNRLQDWKVVDGRLHCIEKRFLGMRTAHLLKYELSDDAKEFSSSVKLQLTSGKNSAGDGSGGFLIGSGNGEMDVRGAAIVHDFYGKGFGIIAGIGTDGKLFIHDGEKGPYIKKAAAGIDAPIQGEVELTLSAKVANGQYELTLSSPRVDGNATAKFPLQRIRGNVGLFSHPGLSIARGQKKMKRTAAQFSFASFALSGEKLHATTGATLGAVLSTQYTLSRNVMKMTAQLMPIAEGDSKTCHLQIKKAGQWTNIAETKVILPGFTAPFRVANWDDSQDIDYRVVYKVNYKDGSNRDHIWAGTVRKDPKDKEKLVIAGFTGNHNNSHSLGGGWGSSKDTKNNWIQGMWFPHQDLTSRVVTHEPDVIFFSGDQVYEGKSPSFADRSQIKMDYLYKWYLWCWAYRDMVKNRPCICLPDDHDVYQGNIWGAGGRKAPSQNHGGYVHPADFVKMVDRTQTSHLPDAFDPTTIDQDITVFYTDMVYGRISFGIIEDRKFKSGPLQQKLPDTGTKRPDHFNNPNFDVTRLNLPGLTLLGDRQLKFIDHWTSNWKGADMKICLSATIFGNMATHHGGIKEGNRLIADLDSNGWPQTGRNKAVRALRKGFAFHLAGDQHLASIVHHGTDEHRDGIWSFCVPSVANFYPRKWMPLIDGENRPAGAPSWQGDHRDGFLNKVSVFAAANPGGPSFGVEPLDLHDKMAGYGIVVLDRSKRSIKMECWPRWAVPGKDAQYSGWPKTISQFDNYARKAAAWLPEISCNLENPVIDVIDAKSNEVVYSVRALGKTFLPKVFAAGNYNIRISKPDLGKTTTLKNIKARTSKGETLKVVL